MADRGAIVVLTGIATAVIGLDRLTKSVVSARYGFHTSESSVNILGDWLQVEYAENRGAAFGLLSGLTPALSVIAVVVVVALLIQFSREPTQDWWRVVALGLVVGGALGNLIDRVRQGFVVDFIAVGPWPNFNVADSAISVGMLLLVWRWTRFERQTHLPERV